MPLWQTVHNVDRIKKPAVYWVPMSGAERLDQMYDLNSSISINTQINTETETWAVVFRPHNKWQYALEMVRKRVVVEFVDGEATISHKFWVEPNVTVNHSDYDVDYVDWETILITLGDDASGDFTVLLN